MEHLSADFPTNTKNYSHHYKFIPQGEKGEKAKPKEGK